MKGVVFTEFLAFVESRFGENMVDDIIDASDLPNGGAYTAVGTYDPAQMTALCGALGAATGEPVAELVKDFGMHLSTTFARDYPALFTRNASFFDFLQSIEAHIHVEVRKLYPDAELPTFTVTERTATRLVMDYRSPRRLGHLAKGMILGTAGKFGVTAQVQTVPLAQDDGEATRFIIDLV